MRTCRYCNRYILALGLCKEHFREEYRQAEKIVRTTRIKGRPYKPTPDVGVNYVYHSRYEDEK